MGLRKHYYYSKIKGTRGVGWSCENHKGKMLHFLRDDWKIRYGGKILVFVVSHHVMGPVRRVKGYEALLFLRMGTKSSWAKLL